MLIPSPRRLLPLLPLLSLASFSTAKEEGGYHNDRELHDDRKGCRCVFDPSAGKQPACWPPASAFARLAGQVSQPLLVPAPPESACYPSYRPPQPLGTAQNTVNSSNTTCADMQAHARDGNWRATQPGSMQAPNWETYTFANGTIDACYLNVSLGASCGQGSVPVVGVDARSVADVQAAVRFAQRWRLRLIVKNTGHDFLGRSSARGSFLLWTHNLKNITFSDSFVPDGAPPSETYKALTLGSGVQWHEAYDAAEANGRFIVGGLSADGSVGAAGGWIQGGGHSAFSARHGLGVDNAVQFTVVTASGTHLTANAHRHADLFWALRGGGGGTFGAVTSVTYRTHERFPLAGVFAQANFSSADVAQRVMTEYVRMHPALTDAGWGGYSFMSAQQLAFFYVAPNTSTEDAQAGIQPFVDFATNATGGQAGAFAKPYAGFYEWYKEIFSNGQQVGGNSELGSRLIPREAAEKRPEEVARLILGIHGGSSLNFVCGGAVAKADPESAALNPAWRKAVGHLTFGQGWEEGASSSTIQQLRQLVIQDIQSFDALGSDLGAYFNEASLYEKNPQKTFFGAHYPRLRQIKNEYDPEGLFVVASGVGSEDWDSELNCRRRH